MGRVRRKKRKRGGRRGLLSVFVLFFAVTALTLLGFSVLEKKLLPPLRDIAYVEAGILAGDILDRAIGDTLELSRLSAEDLLEPVSRDGKFTCLTDTTEVNRFCTMLSKTASRFLSEMPKRRIRVPLGTAAENPLFADKGPAVTFRLVPVGTADVDYETSFVSVGINQVNYKIWLELSVDMKLVSPVFREVISAKRKVLLADIIFGGEVPAQFFAR